MQKILFGIILFFFIITASYGAGNSTSIDLTITPIRSELTSILGGAVSGSVTLYNNTNETHSFLMSVEDCTTNTNNGTPLCNANKVPGMNINSLASWITFNTTGIFSIPARGKKVVGYTINTPVNAIPGGHYGAIFFNTPNINSTTNIGMNRRIGMLLLVTVPGDIIVAPEFGNIVFIGGGAQSLDSNIPSIWELFSPSQTGTLLEKGKKLLMVFSDPAVVDPIVDFINPFWDTPQLDPNTKFTTDLNLPVENKGTIHINPEGKITLHELDGTQLKNIGKEMVKNDNGAIVGEKIVDYLTINEENGNVLPGLKRIFTMSWNGFAREYVTPNGTIAINYEPPGLFYSRISQEEQGYMYPWEKLVLTHTNKKLNAKIDLNYLNPITKERVSKNSEMQINVEYDEIVKTWNSGLLLFIAILIFIRWLIKRRKNNKKNNIDSNLMSHEIHALERARTMMYDKKNELSIRDTIKKKEKKIKHEPPAKVTTTAIKKTVVKNVVTPVKRVIKEVPVIEKQVVTRAKRVIKEVPVIEKKVVAAVKKPTTAIKKTVVKNVVTPVKRVIKEVPVIDLEIPVREEKHSKKEHKKKHKK